MLVKNTPCSICSKIKSNKSIDGIVYCGTHYNQILSQQDERECEICHSKNKVRKYSVSGQVLCSKHYSQMYTIGNICDKTRYDPNDIIIYEELNYAEIILNNFKGKEIGRAKISIDKINSIKKYKWYLQKNGYCCGTVDGNKVLLSRFICNPCDNQDVDHINHDTLDNRDENLRLCSHRENSRNKKSSELTGRRFRGVYFSSINKNYVSQITINDKTVHIKSCKTVDQAIAVRIIVEVNLYERFSSLWNEYSYLYSNEFNFGLFKKELQSLKLSCIDLIDFKVA